MPTTKTLIAKLPIFPEAEFQIGDLWITETQLRKAVVKLYPHIVEKSCIFSKFDPLTGKVVKKYAWHSILSDLNKQMLSDSVINELCNLDELLDA